MFRRPLGNRVSIQRGLEWVRFSKISFLLLI